MRESPRGSQDDPDEGRVIARCASWRVDKSQIVPRNVEGVKADPPAIFFSDTAALLP
jgi:hypothetical protein